MQTAFFCDACKKSYSTVGNLNKHLKRQPLCERWLRLRPGLKDYVEDAFDVQQQYGDQDGGPEGEGEGEDGYEMPRPAHPACLACDKAFANAGNLTRHLATSAICAKWAMYSTLEPITMYARFDPPGEGAQKLIHIIWNVFLADKELVLSDGFDRQLVESENIGHIVGICKDEFQPRLAEIAARCGIGHTAVLYRGNAMDNVDTSSYEAVCDVIDANRGGSGGGGSGKRKNVVVFCSSGYQRSIPMLSYYLLSRHREEAPDVERCVDLLLPHIDRASYASDKPKYVELLSRVLRNAASAAGATAIKENASPPAAPAATSVQ